MPNIPVPEHLELVVSSFGGVGTSFLIRFLSRYKRVNPANDKGSLKHHYVPPTSAHPSQKFIYVFGNPVHATISLFRRNFHRLQSIKIQKASNLNSPIPLEMTLEEYASQGVDRFGFRDHFFNWYKADCMNPILFVRYETLHDNLQQIFDYAGIPKSAYGKFPEKIERKSLQTDISEQTIEQLNQIYEDFLNDLEKIPDIEIREGKPMDKKEMNLQRMKFHAINTFFNIRRSVRISFEKLKDKNIES